MLKSVSGSQTSFDDTTAMDPTKTYYYRVVAFNSVGQETSGEVAAPFMGDACNGMIIHKNDPSHPEAYGGSVVSSAPIGPTPAPVPTPPVLATITVGGKKIDAVVQLTKHGFAFVFDRVTGQPVWPIEERSVPAGAAPFASS